MKFFANTHTHTHAHKHQESNRADPYTSTDKGYRSFLYTKHNFNMSRGNAWNNQGQNQQYNLSSEWFLIYLSPNISINKLLHTGLRDTMGYILGEPQQVCIMSTMPTTHCFNHYMTRSSLEWLCVCKIAAWGGVVVVVWWCGGVVVWWCGGVVVVVVV